MTTGDPEDDPEANAREAVADAVAVLLTDPALSDADRRLLGSVTVYNADGRLLGSVRPTKIRPATNPAEGVPQVSHHGTPSTPADQRKQQNTDRM